MIAPILLQRQNNRLKIHALRGNNTIIFYPISDRTLIAVPNKGLKLLVCSSYFYKLP
jgi:hypothetical protein